MTSSSSPAPETWPAGAIGTWSAPGRVNLIGEHTDYNDGFVLPFAIEYRTTVDLTVRTDHRLRVSSSFDPEPVEVALDDLDDLFPARRDEIVEWARYPLGVAWALLHATSTDPESVPGVDLVFRSDVPVGAGLSSSAAIEGATAVALNDVWGLDQSRVTLAKVGRWAENEAVGAPTGIMDQMASLLGRPDAGTFLDCRTLDAEVTELGSFASQFRTLFGNQGTQETCACGIRRRMTAIASALSSTSTALRPSAWATAPVVPLPAKRSSTRSPGRLDA